MRPRSVPRLAATGVRRIAASVAAGALLACGSGPAAPPAPRLTVMTRNLYLGADLRPAAAAATGTEFLDASNAIWTSVQRNDFADRAQAIAAEIAAAGPDLVALQEVALWRTQRPADSTSATPTPATEVASDHLELLLAALRARGVAYEVGASLELTDLEVPVATGAPPLADVRFTDRDVILVRGGVPFAAAGGAAFASGVDVAAPGGTVRVRRGWTSVLSQGVRFVATGLEADDAGVRAAQAAELGAVLRALAPGFVVLAGDLASAPGTDGHLAATGAGLRDAWTAVHGADGGFTCCWPPDLTEASGGLSSRADAILARESHAAGPERGVSPLRAVSATLVGDAASDRTAAGRWPSDHAGLVVTFAFEERRRARRGGRVR